MSRIFLNKEKFVTMMDELAKSCQLVHSNVDTDMSSGQVSNTYVFKNDDDNIIFQHTGTDYISIWSKNAKMWIINADNLKVYRDCAGIPPPSWWRMKARSFNFI